VVITNLRSDLLGNSYETRLINISSHSKHSGEEVIDLEADNKRVLDFLIKQIHELYRFKSTAGFVEAVIARLI
jgi:hypothetical protein